MQENFLGNIYGFEGRSYAGAVWDKESISPTLNTMTGGNREPMITEVVAIDEQNKQLRQETFGTLTTDGSSPKHNNRVMEIKILDKLSNSEQRNVIYDSESLSPTIQAACGEGGGNCPLIVQKDNMVLIRQATKEGLIPCKIGGGCEPGVSRLKNKAGPSDRERKHLPDADNGEYP